MTVEAFYLSERFRMPVTVLADQLITDGFEDISVPETDDEMKEMGFRVWPRKIHRGPDFYPPTDEIDIPPVRSGTQHRRHVLGLDTHRGRGMTSKRWRPITNMPIG